MTLHYSGGKGLARYWIESIVANNVSSFYGKDLFLMHYVSSFHKVSKYSVSAVVQKETVTVEQANCTC